MHSLSIRKNSLDIGNKDFWYEKKTQRAFYGIFEIADENIKKLPIHKKKIM